MAPFICKHIINMNRLQLYHNTPPQLINMTAWFALSLWKC